MLINGDYMRHEVLHADKNYEILCITQKLYYADLKIRITV